MALLIHTKKTKLTESMALLFIQQKTKFIETPLGGTQEEGG